MGGDFFVRRGHVSMRADDGGDAPVEYQPIARFSEVASAWMSRMRSFHLGRNLRQQRVDRAERAVNRRHEDAALEVHDGVVNAVARLTHVQAVAGRVGASPRPDGALAYTDNVSRAAMWTDLRRGRFPPGAASRLARRPGRALSPVAIS